MIKMNDSTFKKMFSLLDNRERLQVLFLFFFVLLGVALETIGIGLIIPFINIIADPIMASENKYIKTFILLFQIKSQQTLIIYACIGVISILLIKNIMLFLIYYAQAKFLFRKQVKLSAQLFMTYLQRPYIFFTENNSAEFQRNINSSVHEVVNGVIFPAMLMVSECLVAIAIFGLLLWADWFSSLSVLSVLGVTIGGYYYWSRKKIAQYTQIRNDNIANMIKWVNQGVGAIKEIKVLGRERYFYENYIKTSDRYAGVSCQFQLVTFLPRLFFESVTIIALVVIVLMISVSDGDPRSLIPVLGLFAMAAFRILPALNRITTLHNSIQFYQAQLENVSRELSAQDLENHTENKNGQACSSPLVFSTKISIEGLSFRYPNAPVGIINDLSLDIFKGEAVGFVGVSGAGKSTLIDLVLGLLNPTGGCIKVDGVEILECLADWHKLIGYIPQVIYLVDDTISRNVALGVNDEDIDETRVWKVLEIAQLKDDIENLPERLSTLVGEDGARLSGGQRQRIGIARALYHDPEILVLDEATANLDMETERKFSAAIESLTGKKTMLIIAHRTATLEKCDKVYEMKRGNLTKIVGH